ncbi:MAG: DNA polymerase Y family protein [Myxococcota bacterium]
MQRRILFGEVPGFYAAVERVEDPALSDRPVIVGGDPRKRGRVQSASAEALAAGVELDMPMLEALRLCPQARSVRTNIGHYREVSRGLMAALRVVLPRLEPFGLGAAYADLTGSDDAEARGAALCDVVQERMGLPVRVGIASRKFLARLVAQELPERGVRSLAAGEEEGFLSPLPVSRLDGVGRKTAARLEELGASTIGDVARLGRERLQEVFGTHGLRIHAYATGSDDEPLRPERHARSLSREATVRSEPLDLAVLVEHLSGLAANLEAELARQAIVAGKVTLKLRFTDQGVTTRTRTLGQPVATAQGLLEVAQGLLGRTQAGARPVRSIGLQLGSLAPAEEQERQLGLFP